MVVGEVVCVLGATVSVVVAVLAAGPFYWHPKPAHAQLNPIGGMVDSPPRPPPIGLTRAAKGPGIHPKSPGHHLSGQRASERVHVRRMRSQRQIWGLTAHRRPDAPHASPETTEAGPRRIPPLVAYGDRTVGAEKSRYQQHIMSYNPHRGARTQVQRTPGNQCSSGL